jgi:hypothetical protein
MYVCPQSYITHQENTVFLRPPPAYDCLTPRPAKRPRYEGDTRRRPWTREDRPGIASEVMMRHVEATKMCRFQTGFAAEGMLCNEPPIPLRMLLPGDVRAGQSVAGLQGDAPGRPCPAEGRGTRLDSQASQPGHAIFSYKLFFRLLCRPLLPGALCLALPSTVLWINDVLLHDKYGMLLRPLEYSKHNLYH